MTDHVVAYVNWGRWVADCATPGCGNARALTVGDELFDCDAPARPGGSPIGEGACDRTYPIVWPDDPAAVAVRLANLPESQRSWRPGDGEKGGGDATGQA